MARAPRDRNRHSRYAASGSKRRDVIGQAKHPHARAIRSARRREVAPRHAAARFLAIVMSKAIAASFATQH
jgi:hypothetical protein